MDCEIVQRIEAMQDHVSDQVDRMDRMIKKLYRLAERADEMTKHIEEVLSEGVCQVQSESDYVHS